MLIGGGARNEPHNGIPAAFHAAFLLKHAHPLGERSPVVKCRPLAIFNLRLFRLTCDSDDLPIPARDQHAVSIETQPITGGILQANLIFAAGQHHLLAVLPQLEVVDWRAIAIADDLQLHVGIFRFNDQCASVRYQSDTNPVVDLPEGVKLLIEQPPQIRGSRIAWAVKRSGLDTSGDHGRI